MQDMRCHSEVLSICIMADPKLDDRLRQFLEDSDREKARGYTNANILLKVEHVGNQVQELLSRVDHVEQRLDRHGREIRAIKQHIEFDGELSTGQHSIEAVRQEVERQRAEHDAERRAKNEEVTWWRRTSITWIVGAVGFLVIQVVSVFVSVFLSGRK